MLPVHYLPALLSYEVDNKLRVLLQAFLVVLLLRTCRYDIFADMPICRYWCLPICRYFHIILVHIHDWVKYTITYQHTPNIDVQCI